MRWGIPHRSPAPTSRFHSLTRAGPSLSALKGGEGKSAAENGVEVEISIACDGWLAACPEAAVLVESAARAVLTDRDGPLIVGIVFTDDGEQRQLNRTWRGKDAPTNVLSFATADAAAPPPGAPILLGDVVLAFETIAREAREQGKPFADHLRHLVVHGVLHLLGFDHESDAEAAVMEAREAAILTRLGVPDPYSDIM